MTELHQAAREYHRRHKLPITLCRGKKPIGRAWQDKRWSLKEIDQHYRADPELNVGVVLGGIIDIEYDGRGGERALSDLFDGDVPVAPVWLSTRGPHRLFKPHPDLQAIGKASIKFGPLEIRLGANGKGAQSLLPPSVTDGHCRQWQVGLDDCDPPPLPNGVVRRLLQATASTFGGGGGIQEITERTEAIASVHSVDSVNSVDSVHSVPLCNPSPTSTSTTSNAVSQLSAIEAAIRRTLPSSPGHRHRSLFNFARHLKAIPPLAGADLDFLYPIVGQWHQAALPNICTKDFDETWADFVNAWHNVRFPVGKEPIRMIYQQAIAQRHLPRAAQKYKSDVLRRLVLLCRELQRVSGHQPFFLACRTAGELLGITHVLANKWLRLLVLEGILEISKRGTLRHATRYRYLGD